LGELLNFEVMT